MEKTNWIDYKELKAKLDLGEVLQLYGVELRLKGEQHHGLCPLPGHEGEKKPSFSAHLKKKIFHCFGCGGKGNLLDFAVLMEGHNLDDKKAFRQVVMKLQERLLDGDPPDEESARPVTTEERGGAVEDSRVLINHPLGFELKSLDPRHPYLKVRGFSPETIDYFGLGFTKKGLMKGRIAIPLHDEEGNLIGYAGRLVDNRAVSEDNPKYLFPGSRKDKEGVRYAFKKSRFLYNGHRVGAVSSLVVVEGFPDCWWLHQCGFPHTVAVMGASCSDVQAEAIIESVRPEGCVYIMTDGDGAGRRCAKEIFEKTSPHRTVGWIKLGGDKQPTDYSEDELAQMVP